MAECELCYDTGCSCGGIGMNCHGCCSCKAGQKALNNRADALVQIAKMVAPRSTEAECKRVRERVLAREH
jgi:hypothetical protein